MNANALAMEPEVAVELAAIEVEVKRNPQTGPLTEAGKDASKRNAVRHGLTGAGMVLPDGLRESVDHLRDEFAATYPPVVDDDWRLIGQAALGFARFQAAIDEQTYYIADRSEQALANWDEAEAATAEKLANRLAVRPSWVVSRLLTTLAGCLWLLRQWRLLANALEHSGEWDESRRATALHLLGIATIDHEADRSAVRLGTLDERRALANGQIERLEARVAGDLAVADGNRRERAIEGKGYLLEPGFAKLVRYENAALRMYERAIDELKARQQARTESEKPSPAIEPQRPEIAPEVDVEESGIPIPEGYANYTLDAIERRIADMDAWMAREYPRAFAQLQALGDEDEDEDIDDETEDEDVEPEALVQDVVRKESRRAKQERLKREREARKRKRRR